MGNQQNSEQNNYLNNFKECLQQTKEQAYQVQIIEKQISFAEPIQNNINPYAPRQQIKDKINKIIQKQKINSEQKEEGMKLDQKYWKKINPDIVIEGTWDQRYPHGLTKIYFPSGFIFIAYFKHGSPLYEDCLFIYPNGCYYRGAILNGKFHGKGKYCSDDFIYEGNWCNSLPEGEGKETYLKQNIEYNGQFKNGQKEGSHCTYKIKSNSKQNLQLFKYEGQFKDNDFSGEVIMKTDFKQIYPLVEINDVKNQEYKFRGQLERDMKSGRAQIKCRHNSARSEIYQGGLTNGILNGVGTVVSTIGKEPESVWWFNGYKLKRFKNFSNQKQTAHLLGRIENYFKQAKKYSEIIEKLSQQLGNKYKFKYVKQKEITQSFYGIKSKQMMVQLCEGKYVYVYVE